MRGLAPLQVRSVLSDDFSLLCEIVKSARADAGRSDGPAGSAPLVPETGAGTTARPALAKLLTGARIPGLILRAIESRPELRRLDPSIVTIAEEQLALAAEMRGVREAILEALWDAVGHEIGPFLTLKGYAIEIGCYEKRTVFLNNDIDIIIPKRLREVSCRVRDTLSLSPSAVEYGFLEHHDLLPLVFKIPFAEIWQESEETSLYGGFLRVPCPADQLLLACISAFRHSYRFKDICYIDCIITSQDIDWERFWRMTKKSQALKPVVCALLIADELMASLANQPAIPCDFDCFVGWRLLQIIVARAEARLAGGEPRKKRIWQVGEAYCGSRLNILPWRQKPALVITSLAYLWLNRYKHWPDILRSVIKETDKELAGDMAVVSRGNAIFFEDVSLNRSCFAGKFLSWILKYQLKKGRKLGKDVAKWARNMPLPAPLLDFYVTLSLSLRGVMAGTAKSRAKHPSWQPSESAAGEPAGH